MLVQIWLVKCLTVHAAVLLDPKTYSDWVPDMESVELVESFGSYLSCVTVKLSSGVSFNLGVFQLSCAVHEAFIAWESFGKSDVDLRGVFCVRLAGDNFDSCNVDFFLKAKGKIKPPALVQSVLLGLNMLISTTVETKEADLADELQFLKKL